jgi:hypothetical protein
VSKMQVMIRMSEPMIEAIRETAPKDVPTDVWSQMGLAEKMRVILTRWLQENGARYEEPVYKRTGRPPKVKKSSRSRKRA